MFHWITKQQKREWKKIPCHWKFTTNHKCTKSGFSKSGSILRSLSSHHICCLWLYLWV